MYVLMDKPDGKVVAAAKNLGKAFKNAEKKATVYHLFNLLNPME